MAIDMNTLQRPNLKYPELQQMLQKAMRIGIDIDGVLVDTVDACIRKIKQDYGIIMSYDEWQHWNPHENSELHEVGIQTQADTVKFFHDIVHNASWNIPPIQGATRGIQSLKSAGRKLIALTGRADDARNVTIALLDKHFAGQLDEVLFSNHDVPEKKKPKSQVAKENGIGLMIEDNIHYAIELALGGIPTILLTRPWNQDAEIPEGLPIFRLESWEEISTYLL